MTDNPYRPDWPGQVSAEPAPLPARFGANVTFYEPPPLCRRFARRAIRMHALLAAVLLASIAVVALKTGKWWLFPAGIGVFLFWVFFRLWRDRLSEVIIHRNRLAIVTASSGGQVIPFERIASARAIEPGWADGLRPSTSGWPTFHWSGIYIRPQVGNVRVYATSQESCVLLETTDSLPVILSVENREMFLRVLHAARHGELEIPVLGDY